VFVEPRLRQVALVSADLDGVATRLQETFGWVRPFHDPGVGAFGLANAVFAAGDTFVEVVAPTRPDTTAGRYLARRGGDSGYMAIFQVPDLAAARRRIAAAGVRVVWAADFADIAGTHLHPKDLPGALVSIDWADPPESWRWAGPQWTGRAPPGRTGGITGLTVEVDDPLAAAARWAAVLGLGVTDRGSAVTIGLAAAGQRLRFVPAPADRGEGIVEVQLAGIAGPVEADIGGVRFVRT
jgi:hypothetical protein